jgi:hypothetical protein
VGASRSDAARNALAQELPGEFTRPLYQGVEVSKLDVPKASSIARSKRAVSPSLVTEIRPVIERIGLSFGLVSVPAIADGTVGAPAMQVAAQRRERPRKRRVSILFAFPPFPRGSWHRIVGEEC